MSGLFGVCHQQTATCLEDLFHGTDYHTHLGTEEAGIAVRRISGGIWKKIHDLSTGAQFKDRFIDDINHLQSELSIKDDKVRCGIGVISNHDPQPLVMLSALGDFALACSGVINNINFLINHLFQNGVALEANSGNSVGTTKIVVKLLVEEKNFAGGIENIWDKIQGSMSLLILDDEEIIIAARDRWGVTSLVIGKKEGGFAVASESFALENTGYEICHFLKPGEIVEIDCNGYRTIKPGDENHCRLCAFYFIYTGWPASIYEGAQVEQARYHCGHYLAMRDEIKADIVTGVPDSGIAHAYGYAQKSGLPLARPIAKYTPSYGRSFTPPNQKRRDAIAKRKIVLIKSIIRDQSMIICDDSIVRGTQLHRLLERLYGAGAKEIHIRPACPPLMFPCHYLRSTRYPLELASWKAIGEIYGNEMPEELAEYIDAINSNNKKMPEIVAEYLNPDSAAYASMVEHVRRMIGATTLRYQRLDDMVAAIGLPKEKLCLYCWTGEKIH